MAQQPNNQKGAQTGAPANTASDYKARDIAEEEAKAKAKAEASANATQPGDAPKPEIPKPQPPTTVSPVPGNEESDVMDFPHDVLLTVKAGERYRFPRGPRRVPVRLKDHWYLKANGAKEV